jgi:hypothetical protein
MNGDTLTGWAFYWGGDENKINTSGSSEEKVEMRLGNYSRTHA